MIKSCLYDLLPFEDKPVAQLNRAGPWPVKATDPSQHLWNWRPSCQQCCLSHSLLKTKVWHAASLTSHYLQSSHSTSTSPALLVLPHAFQCAQAWTCQRSLCQALLRLLPATEPSQHLWNWGPSHQQLLPWPFPLKNQSPIMFICVHDAGCLVITSWWLAISFSSHTQIFRAALISFHISPYSHCQPSPLLLMYICNNYWVRYSHP